MQSKIINIVKFLIVKNKYKNYISFNRINIFLYFIQGVHLIKNDSCLFLESIEFDDNGPICPFLIGNEIINKIKENIK